jgi:hypothetical protein
LRWRFNLFPRYGAKFLVRSGVKLWRKIRIGRRRSGTGCATLSLRILAHLQCRSTAAQHHATT